MFISFIFDQTGCTLAGGGALMKLGSCGSGLALLSPSKVNREIK